MIYPLITIGITCYNAADTILRAIEGALHQDYPNFEIVVVDDCSGDHSFDVLCDVAVKIPDKIRVFRNDGNLGVAGARNRVIAEARGDFLAFFDDDDDCSPARLSIQYNTIITYEDFSKTKNILCFGSGKKIYPNGYEVHFKAVGSEGEPPIGDDMVRYHLMMDRPQHVFYGSGTPSCSMMARKSVFESVHGFDVNMRRIEDSDICIRLGLSGTHFIGCPEEVIFQYASEGGDKNPRIGYEAEVYLIDKYKDYLKLHGVYHYAKDWTLVRYYHFSRQKRLAACQLLKMIVKYPFRTLKRFIMVAPRRLRHEWRMHQDARA